MVSLFFLNKFYLENNSILNYSINFNHNLKSIFISSLNHLNISRKINHIETRIKSSKMINRHLKYILYPNNNSIYL